MKDKIRSLVDVGIAVAGARRQSGLSTVEIARRSGRSRDVLNRLERGQDVSLSSLLAILNVLGQAIEFVSATRPTLEEMARRFAANDEGDDTDE